MNESFFMLGSRINAVISETVIPGCHIKVDGRQYEQLSRRPRGRRVLRKLQNLSTNDRFTIYN